MVSPTTKFVLDQVESIAGKTENASFQYFLFFLQYFQTPPYGAVKSRTCMLKG